MQIDNKARAAKVKLLYMLILLILLLITGGIFLMSDKILLVPAVISVTLMLLFVIYVYVVRISYISALVSQDSIRFRYKVMSPFKTSNNSVKIESKKLVKTEIVKNAFGLRYDLVFYVHTPNGIAKYNPISLNGLKRGEVEKLLKAFMLIETMNKSS